MLVGRRLALGIHRGREGEKQKGEGERKSSEREGFPQHGSAPESESYGFHENAKRVRLSKRCGATAAVFRSLPCEADESPSGKFPPPSG
jgi:hypothetical protein